MIRIFLLQLVVFLLGANNFLFAQNYFFLNGPQKISSYVELEKERNSIPLANAQLYWTQYNDRFDLIGQPVRFTQKDLIPPIPIVISYYFSLSDSIVRIIEFEIDTSILIHKQYDEVEYIKSQAMLNWFSSIYDTIFKELTHDNADMLSDSLHQVNDVPNQTYWQRKNEFSDKKSSTLMYLTQFIENGDEYHYRIRAELTYLP